jgi:hypothetical protein
MYKLDCGLIFEESLTLSDATMIKRCNAIEQIIELIRIIRFDDLLACFLVLVQ